MKRTHFAVLVTIMMLLTPTLFVSQSGAAINISRSVSETEGHELTGAQLQTAITNQMAICKDSLSTCETTLENSLAGYQIFSSGGRHESGYLGAAGDVIGVAVVLVTLPTDATFLIIATIVAGALVLADSLEM